ncbi:MULTISPECIES: hypothetical protein [unclassified Bradyrhizobium]|uniref:hypothetical protein n=1 Tax=unclassified Bradyrhizobium TaxID=2631580 RepID=UPI001BD17893|nr:MULTISPECIES: hypothetical protein [unclassified Bradyrhizobium]WOH52927.1 hypothetical protein RX328_13085 [Bradyrhizobium sp. sBnM-33]
MNVITSERNSLISETWAVLAAAKDLSDTSMQLICRRVIEGHLAGRTPREADAVAIRAYFR